MHLQGTIHHAFFFPFLFFCGNLFSLENYTIHQSKDNSVKNPSGCFFPLIPTKALYLSGSWQETDGTLKGAIKRVKEETVYRGVNRVEGSQCDEEPWGW